MCWLFSIKMKIINVIDAWITAFNPSKGEVERAYTRASVCDTCEHKVELKSTLLKQFVKHDKILNKYKCGKCGCPLAKKLFAHFKTSCPLDKWEV